MEPEIRRVCATLELIGPHEYCRSSELIQTALHNWRELRDAPALAEADLLEDHDTCIRNVYQLDHRICAVEKRREYFGMSRWEEFEPALRNLRTWRSYWNDCATATAGSSETWKDRRLALQRLRDG